MTMRMLDGDKNPELVKDLVKKLESSPKKWVKGYDALEERERTTLYNHKQP